MPRIGFLLVYAQILDVKDECELINKAIESLKKHLATRKPVTDLHARRCTGKEVSNPHITIVPFDVVEHEQITEQDLLKIASEGQLC
jgi:hypothetical protein